MATATPSVSHNNSTFTTSSNASPLTVRAWNTLLTQPDGRDKVLRLVQYICKLLRGVLDARGHPNLTVSANAAALEGALSSARQAWRLFKWTSIYTKHQHRLSPHSYSISPSISLLSSVIRTIAFDFVHDFNSSLVLLADVGMFLYYVFDNFTFLAKHGLVSANAKKLAKRAAQWWAVGTSAAAISSLFRAYLQTRRQRMAWKENLNEGLRQCQNERTNVNGINVNDHICKTGHDGSGDDGENENLSQHGDHPVESEDISQWKSIADRNAEIAEAGRLRRNALILATRQIADAVVAATTGFELPVHSGVVGACGTLSSFIGLSLAWPTLPTD